MKTISMDYKEYEVELDLENHKGYRSGIGEARRVFLEMLAGASDDSILHDIDADDSKLYDLVKDLRPRFELFKRSLK